MAKASVERATNESVVASAVGPEKGHVAGQASDHLSQLETAVDVCSIAATLDVIGDRWSLLILRDVFRGGHRFSEIQADLGIAKNLLSDRLSRLVKHGLLERVQYQDRPVRYDYRLTSKGADLSPALIALMRWGDRWYADNGAPTVLIHETCGQPLEQAVRCQTCDDIVSPGQIRSRPGPGRKTDDDQ